MARVRRGGNEQTSGAILEDSGPGGGVEGWVVYRVLSCRQQALPPWRVSRSKRPLNRSVLIKGSGGLVGVRALAEGNMNSGPLAFFALSQQAPIQ